MGSSHFMMDQSDDVSAAWENLLKEVWFQRHVVAAHYVVGVRLFANREFASRPMLDKDGTALPAFSDASDDSPFFDRIFS